jgi:hypothetical protein
MALTAPKGNANKKFAPQANIQPGVYPSRVVQIIDFGLQPQKPYKGVEKDPAQEIGLTYELVDEFMKDEEGKDIEGKPRWISETLPFYGLYADKAKSTQRYLALDPTQAWGGDFSKAIGQPVNVTVVNNPGQAGKIYDNVAGIAAMRPKDADKLPELKNPARLFDIDNPDLETFNSFPEWIRDKIKGNLNYQGSTLQKLLGGKEPNKIPVEEEQDGPPWVEGQDDNNPY